MGRRGEVRGANRCSGFPFRLTTNRLTVRQSATDLGVSPTLMVKWDRTAKLLEVGTNRARRHDENISAFCSGDQSAADRRKTPLFLLGKGMYLGKIMDDDANSPPNFFCTTGKNGRKLSTVRHAIVSLAGIL
ncbi:unnamed protein product [Nippostrongylus brasiliensis]|uniref:Transposase n=1 Tax=Nippostrongylus brasiliensis TaxID=27835 RepID=A0A0N4Y4S1_NIPBR|nr:unnamed protein product [Nippostrongylus brasiliensis]